jgi:hypothetical protein
MTENQKRYKSRNMRYKKSALQMLNIDDIERELDDIRCEYSDIQWFMSDDETLIDALDGDEDEEFEFRMLFSDLSAKGEQLDYAIRNNDVTKYFDDFIVNLVGDRYNVIGYDSYQEDYFSLTQFEAGLAQTESGKRLMRLTKDELLSISGQCLGIVIAFLDIRHSYDYLKSAFDILKEKNTGVLNAVKRIEELYELAEKANFYFRDPNTKLFENCTRELPDEVWIAG